MPVPGCLPMHVGCSAGCLLSFCCAAATASASSAAAAAAAAAAAIEASLQRKRLVAHASLILNGQL